MMVSWQGNLSHIIAHLWGESISHRWVVHNFFLVKISKFGESLHVFVWIAFGINGVYMLTQCALYGLFSHLERTLQVIVLQVD